MYTVIIKKKYKGERIQGKMPVTLLIIPLAEIIVVVLIYLIFEITDAFND